MTAFVCSQWWFIVLKEIRLLFPKIMESPDLWLDLPVVDKNDSFVDLTHLDYSCLEILLISEYHRRKEIFNSFFFKCLD